MALPSDPMRENSRVRSQRFELSLDVKQVAALLLAALVILGGVFVLGVSAGRQAALRAAAPAPADTLARLDDPLPVTTREEPPSLTAHDALVSARPLDKTLPVPAVKTAQPGGSAFGADARLRERPPASPTSESGAPPPTPPTLTAIAPVTPTPTAPSTTAATPTLTATATDDSVRPERRPAARAEVEGAGPSFTIQVASTPRRGEAEHLAKKLAARKPRIVEADVPGKGRWYRVQIGAYGSRDAAARQLTLLARAGVHGFVTGGR
jgi:cell division septation protein DedD